MISAAVIGLGSIGARHLANLLMQPEITKIYAFDPDPNRCAALQIPPNDRVVCVNEFGQIPIRKLQLALICTPNHVHDVTALPFIKENITTFIEKPFVLEPVVAESILARQGAPIIIGANMRYYKPVMLAKKMVEKEELGKLIHVRAWFGHLLSNWRPGTDYKKAYSAIAEQGGGVLWDGIHELDYIHWMFGPVSSVSGTISNHGILGIDVEETADVQFLHDNGLLSFIHLDYLQPLKTRGLEISGSQGTFLWESIGKKPEKMNVVKHSATGTEVIFSSEQYDGNEAYLDQLHELMEVVQGKAVQETNLLDAATATVEINWISQIRKENNS